MNTKTVTVAWLNNHLSDDHIIILDASIPTTVMGDVSNLKRQFIPGSRKLDIKKFSNQRSVFPNTIPSPKQFETECQRLGINNTSKIVVYDNMGIYSSPRVWWLFKVMGHENIAVLDGGLPEWVGKGYAIAMNYAQCDGLGGFRANYQPRHVKKYRDILSNVDKGDFLIVDARSEGRFNGTSMEPRKHLQSGHIPNSINIPYKNVLENGKFKDKEAIRALFETKLGANKDLVFSCGSGLTACIVLLASEIAYIEGLNVYDGSWTEWAEKQQLFTNLNLQ